MGFEGKVRDDFEDFWWKIMDLKYLDLELEAHTWWFCSTHEYYKTTKYELLTPTPSASSSTGVHEYI